MIFLIYIHCNSVKEYSHSFKITRNTNTVSLLEDTTALYNIKAIHKS